VGFARGIIVLAAWLAAAPAWAGDPYPFDDSGYLGDAKLMPDWSATMARQLAQSRNLEICLANAESCPPLYKGLSELLHKAATLPPERQVKLVNFYVNRKRYRRDRSSRLETPLADGPLQYRSRWATVEEFLLSGGDCEDYVTTKYFLLRQLGFAIDQLRIVVTFDRKAHDYHAVLAVRQDDGNVLLLDSNNVIHTGGRHTYRFIYAINEKSIWDHEGPTALSWMTRNYKEKPA
jgi:predicted transglutaminase-like cysteine proteinase